MLAELLCKASCKRVIYSANAATGDCGDCSTCAMVTGRAMTNARLMRCGRRSMDAKKRGPAEEASALHAEGKLDAAEKIYRSLVTTEGSAQGFVGLGRVLLEQGRADQALEVFGDGLKRHSTDLRLTDGRAVSLERLKRVGDALAAYEEVLARAPKSGRTWNNVAGLLNIQGRNDEAFEAYSRAVALEPNDPIIHSNLLFIMNYSGRFDQAALLAEHRRWAERHAIPLGAASPPHGNLPDPDRRLRVAYISADFWTHPVAYFIGAVIANHDRERFEVFCYSATKRPDRLTEALRRMRVVWRDIAWLDNAATAELIRNDAIDILVDLAGHTAGHRLLALARNPAPIQATYLGYPNTTGLPAVGYRFTDAWADPPGESDRLHSETLMRLSGGFLAYTPPSDMPAVRELPARAAGHLTFGSFNNLAKISPETVALWSRVLSAVPDSRLLVKGRSFADAPTRERFSRLAAEHGILAERLSLLWEPGRARDHFEVWNRVDIALDTTPYNGTTTICEALWMGVPVIALAGDRHAARVGVSILNAAGLPELAAPTQDAYVAIALALAGDLEQLASLRASLRARLARSPLLDTRRLTRELENAYRTLWLGWCAGAAKGPAS